MPDYISKPVTLFVFQLFIELPKKSRQRCKVKMDNLTKEQRHKNMQRIRSTETQIEVTLRKELWSRGYRYRKNYKALPGKPDIVLTKYKICIFCDSEFFHGKDWDIRKPKMMTGTNPDYWVPKIERNMERDLEIDRKLLLLGWTVIRFWGKDILKDTDRCVKVIEEVIFDNLLKDKESL